MNFATLVLRLLQWFAIFDECEFCICNTNSFEEKSLFEVHSKQKEHVNARFKTCGEVWIYECSGAVLNLKLEFLFTKFNQRIFD